MKVKNKIKQILSIIVIAMMMMSLFTVNAFAAVPTEKYEISITGAPYEGAVFTAYKVMDVTDLDATNQLIAYKPNNNFKSFFENSNYGNYKASALEKITSDSEKEALAVNLQKFINANSSITGTTTLSNLEAGYYIVLQTNSKDNGPWVAASPVLVALPSKDKISETTVSAQPKINQANVEKHILKSGKDANTADFASDVVDENSENTGVTIKYVTESDVPNYSTAYDVRKIQYVLTDTLSSGLTYTKGSMVVYGKKKTGEYETIKPDKYSLTEENNKVIVSFTGNFGNITQYSKIRLGYSATLNENAVIAGEGNKNNIELEYSNNHLDYTKVNKKDDKVCTYTYQLGVVKKDSATKEALSGVVFTLKNADGKYVKQNGELSDSEVTLTTDTNGKIVVKGLKNGEYSLQEKTPKDGYIPRTDIINLNITINNGDYKNPILSGTKDDTDGVYYTEVLNTKGVTLPTTGGAGTWMFTIGGLVLMAGAVVVFMATRKKKAN